MSYTSADLANIKRAIATGATRVRIGDMDVQYNSLTDLLAVQRMIEADLGVGTPRQVTVDTSYDRGL